MATNKSISNIGNPRLIFFSATTDEPALVESLHLALRSGNDYLYRLTSSVEEVKEIVGRSTRVVWFVNCTSKELIADVYQALGALESRISDGTLKVFLLNTLRHPKLQELVKARLGVEVLDPPITQKAVIYKLKNALINVHQNYLKSTLEVDAKIAVPSEGRTAFQTKPRLEGQEVGWKSSIESEVDFWWIPDGRSIRQVLGTWLVDLVGPSPVAGTWESIPDLTQGDQRAWFWKPRWLADEAFQTPNGRWIYFGSHSPEFSWAKTTWNFVGKTPRLIYCLGTEIEPKFIRFEWKEEDGFTAAENSNHAKLLLPRIEKTFEARPKDKKKAAAQEPSSFPPSEYDQLDFGDSGLEDSVPAWVLDGTIPASELSNPLVPHGKWMGATGLAEFKIPGVTSGKNSFAKASIDVDVVRKNGVLGDASNRPPKVYHVNREGATLLLEASQAEIGDRFHFRFRFKTDSDRSTDCMMEWELKEIEMALGQELLARGDFIGGDRAPLAYALEKYEKRKRELREFFETAKL